MTHPHPTIEEDMQQESSLSAAEVELDQEASRSWVKGNRQVIFLVGIVGLFMLAAHFTPLRAWITNVQLWKNHLRELGGFASAGFVLLCAFSVFVGVPRLPLCATAGLIFGFWEGLAFSLMGSTVGSYGAFLVARMGGRHAVLQRASQMPWLEAMITKPTLLRVFWVRQIMLPGLVLNVLLGVTTVKHRIFMLGTMLGYLPLNLAFTLVGSGLGKDSLAKTLSQLMAAAGILNVVGWLIWRMKAKRKV